MVKDYEMTYTKEQIYSMFASFISSISKEFNNLADTISHEDMKKIHNKLVMYYHPDFSLKRIDELFKQGVIDETEKNKQIAKSEEMIRKINIIWLDYSNYMSPREGVNYIYPSNNIYKNDTSYQDMPKAKPKVNDFQQNCNILGIDPTAALEYYDKLKSAGYQMSKENWLKERINNKHKFDNAAKLVDSKKTNKNFYSALHYLDLVNFYQLEIEVFSINNPTVPFGDIFSFEQWLNDIIEITNDLEYEDNELVVQYKYDKKCLLFKEFLNKLYDYKKIAELMGTKLIKLYNSYSINPDGTKCFEDYLKKKYDEYISAELVDLKNMTRADLEQKYMLFNTNLGYKGSLMDFIKLIKKCLPICEQINVDLTDVYVEYSIDKTKGSNFSFYEWLSTYACMKLYSCENYGDLLEHIIKIQVERGNDIFHIITSLAGEPNIKQNEKKR